MTSLFTRTVPLVTFVAAALATVWLVFKPQFLSGSTYVMAAALLVSTAAIGINAWNNAQAATSTSEVIHNAEVAPPTR